MGSNAFRDADLIIVLGTRMNDVIAHAAPPRLNKDATIARIESDPEELGTSARNVDIPSSATANRCCNGGTGDPPGFLIRKRGRRLLFPCLKARRLRQEIDKCIR
jgi:hypothetical protein